MKNFIFFSFISIFISILINKRESVPNLQWRLISSDRNIPNFSILDKNVIEKRTKVLTKKENDSLSDTTEKEKINPTKTAHPTMPLQNVSNQSFLTRTSIDNKTPAGKIETNTLGNKIVPARNIVASKNIKDNSIKNTVNTKLISSQKSTTPKSNGLINLTRQSVVNNKSSNQSLNSSHDNTSHNVPIKKINSNFKTKSDVPSKAVKLEKVGNSSIIKNSDYSNKANLLKLLDFSNIFDYNDKRDQILHEERLNSFEKRNNINKEIKENPIKKENIQINRNILNPFKRTLHESFDDATLSELVDDFDKSDKKDDIMDETASLDDRIEPKRINISDDEFMGENESPEDNEADDADDENNLDDTDEEKTSGDDKKLNLNSNDDNDDDQERDDDSQEKDDDSQEKEDDDSQEKEDDDNQEKEDDDNQEKDDEDQEKDDESNDNDDDNTKYGKIRKNKISLRNKKRPSILDNNKRGKVISNPEYLKKSVLGQPRNTIPKNNNLTLRESNEKFGNLKLKSFNRDSKMVS